MLDAMTALRILFYSASVLLAMNGCGQSLGAVVDDLHGRHRSAYEDAKSAKRLQLELSDYSTEGGAAVGYFRESGELILFDVRLFGEMVRSEYSCLWHDTGCFIFVERVFKYNRPFYLNEEEAKRVGDTEAFDPKKTVVLQRFAFFDEAKEVYAECEPATDLTQFIGPADLAAMMD